mmetsp:Transcript_20568/g.24500  ORF Transcript_20568/g.24500 Transcript_20568/m.24500 type:complete len:82 (+) Transcript_20568:112-357(+)
MGHTLPIKHDVIIFVTVIEEDELIMKESHRFFWTQKSHVSFFGFHMNPLLLSVCSSPATIVHPIHPGDLLDLITTKSWMLS